MQPYEADDPEFVEALRAGVVTTNSEPFADDQGVFMSGFAPFFDSKGELAGGPVSEPEFRFTMTEQPIFPFHLANAGVTSGSASFMLLVDREGQLQDFLLLEATHLKFGEALAAVLPSWTFHPTEINGRFVNTTSRIDVNSHSSGSVVSFSVSDDLQNLFSNRKLIQRGSESYQVAELRDLDRLPDPVHIVEPLPPHPELVGPEGIDVVFSFYIDTEGTVQIPSLEDTGDQVVDEQILEAVQNALIQWEFRPPTIESQPVVVRVLQPFRFSKESGDVPDDSGN